MKKHTIRNERYLKTLLLVVCMLMPAWAYSAHFSGSSGGAKWEADFGLKFENNTGHSYSWWTGDGEGSMYERLCKVVIGNGATCTTADPGFDIQLGVGVKHKKDMEYRKSAFDYYLVKPDGSKKKVGSGSISSDDSENFPLTNISPSYVFLSHPQLFRTGSGVKSYEHTIGTRVTMTRQAYEDGYTRIEVSGYSEYFKSPSARKDVYMKVKFDYFIQMSAPKFETASEPEYNWNAPDRMTLVFSNGSLPRINKSQLVNDSESARVGVRFCGVSESKVTTEYNLTVQEKSNGQWYNFSKHNITVEGYDPKEVNLQVPINRPFRIQFSQCTTTTLAMATAYKGSSWASSEGVIKQISLERFTFKDFSNDIVNLKADFNQVTGKVTLSWEKKSTLPEGINFYLYRTLLNEDGSYAGNRTELGSTTLARFEDSADRGMQWGRKYRYELVALKNTWMENGFKIPTSPEPLTQCNWAQVQVSTMPKLDFNLTQDMEMTEKIKLTWDFKNIPEQESDLEFRVHRIKPDGTLEQDYGNVSARRKDGKATFVDDKPESKCEVYQYYVQLDLFDPALHFYSNTITARITASTTITELNVTKGSSNEGVRVTWRANQVGTNATLYKVLRRFVGTSEWSTVYTVKGTAAEYTYLDTSTEPGRYYEYQVEAYGDNCDDNDTPLLTDSRLEAGFGQGSGVISGRVTFGTGTAVDNVKVNLLRSDDEANGQNHFYARQLLEPGDGIVWSPSADDARELLSDQNDWTVQMWVRPDNVANDKMLELFDIGDAFSIYLIKEKASDNTYKLGWLNYDSATSSKFQAYLCDDIHADEYTHLTMAHTHDSLFAYVNGELKKAILLAKPNYDAKLSDLSGKVNIAFGNNAFTGYLDEVRLWSKCLQAKEVKGNFDRMIGGREEGLKLYWPFDEGLDDYAFDISRTNGVSNNNHPSTGTSESSTITPSSTQLSLYGRTNESGEYVIRGIPFTGSGTGYTVLPELGIHEFSPATRTGFISPGSMSLNNYDFTDISSFKVSGRIYYEGTDIPVDSVKFDVDGTPCMADGELVYSDANGEYTISVPIGFHYITASREGHTFVANGRYPQEKGTTFEFRTDQTINFTDNTLVHFGGRLTGGSLDGSQPLGYGVSTNTIGQATLQLEALDYPQCRLNVVERNNGLVTEIVNNTADVPLESNSDRVGSTSWKAGGDDNAMKYIYIKTDPKTGEFSTMLPPLRYRVSSVKFEHNPELNNASVFNNLNAIDLTKVHEYVQPDTLWDDSHSTYEELFKCNKTLRLTYRSPLEFDVEQLGAPGKGLFGNDSVTISGTNQPDITVPVVDASDEDHASYLYGYPIFEQNNQYEFNVRVYEPYVNYDDDAEGRRYEIALADSIISIDNEMGETVLVAKEKASNETGTYEMGDIVHLESNQLKLDSLGSAVYKWKAGFPNLTAPFTRTMNIFTTVDGTVYGWKQGAMEGIVFGCIPTGNNFVTTGPNKLVMVLRDPPGSNSSAYWQTDTLEITSKDLITFQGFTENLGIKVGHGIESNIFAGVGVLKNVANAKAQIHDEKGFEVIVEDVYGWGHNHTKVYVDKVNTSNSNGYVGADGDIFIGMSKNYLFGGAMIVGLKQQSDGSYAISMDKGMSVGSNYNTLFRYTQKYIESTQIPNLKMLRNLLLTQVSDASLIPTTVDRPMFYTTLSPEDPRYGSSNTDKEIWGDQASDPLHPEEGPSYTMRVPEDFEGVDSIAFYNKSVDDWIECMRQNEEDKAKAFSNGLYFNRNVSWDRGTTVNHTFTDDDKRWDTNGVNSSVKVYWKMENGVEATLETVKTFTYLVENFDVHQRTTYKYTDADEYKETFGYTFDDANRSAALSIDVYKSTRGWSPIFRTRGGQTRCPWEGEQKTKYYTPVTTLNYATMKIDNPKISIPDRMITGVPTGRDATLEVVFSNESETGEEVLYPTLVCTNNPDGLQVYVDGAPIGDGYTIAIPYGVQTKKTLTIRQSDTSVLDYKDVGLALYSPCLFNSMYDSADFSIQFTQSAPSATVLVDKTVVNAYDVSQAPDQYLTVTAKDYDRTFKGFKSLRVKYRFIGDNSWITAHEFFNGIGMVPEGGLQDGQSLLPDDKSSVSHSFALPLIDGHYMVCVETTCQLDKSEVTWQSEEIEVVKDTHGPKLLGQAYPNTGLLTPGDDIHIKFNEPIRGNYLTKAKNFSLVGDLNESPIDHYVSLQLNGTPLVYEGYVPVSNTSFASSMWLYRQSGGTIFEHSSTSSKIAISVDDEGFVTLTVDNEQFAALPERIPANQWVYLTTSYVHTGTEDYYDAQFSTDEETHTLFNHQVVPEYTNTGQLIIGDGLKGAMHDLSVWAEERTPMQLREYMYKSIPVYKDGLVGYWRMNEGHGTQVTDCARGRNIYMNAESWNLNNDNLAAHLDGTAYVKANVATEAITDDDNYMLSLWFKGEKDANAGASLFSLTDRMSVDFEDNHDLVLRTYRGQSSLNSEGESHVLTDVNYSDGLWHHFALNVRRGTSAVAFIDGQPVLTLNETEIPAFAASHVFLGARERNVDGALKADRLFKGDIDEFAVWKATLDGTSLSESRYFQYDSISPSLLVYYPMEHKYKDASGVIHTEFSLQSGKKSTNGELRTAEGVGVTQALNAPPLKTIATRENLDFDFTVSEDEIYIQLKTLPSRMHGNLVSFTVQGVPDVYGNLSESITWTARANYSTLKWNTANYDYLSIAKEYTTSNSIEVSLINTGSDSNTFELKSLPTWIKADITEGSIGLGQKETITFTFTANAPLGTRYVTIYAANSDGILEPLTFWLYNYGNAPTWYVDNRKYESTMNIVGQVYVQDKISTQEMTAIYAFIGDECRGVAHTEFMTSRDAFFTNLVVYGNESDRDKPITFRVYDGERGVVYCDVISTLDGEKKDVKFTSNLLLGNYDRPVKWNASDLVEQLIRLNYNWNWASLYVEPLTGKSSPADVLGTNQNFFCIKDKPGNISFLKGGAWEGTLSALQSGQMYKIRMVNEYLCYVRGQYINTRFKALTIHEGYNWIGSLSIYNLGINEAFADLKPAVGDYVIAKDAVAFYNGFTWEGTLQNILHGVGYIYYSSDKGDKTFHFPNLESLMMANQALFETDDEQEEWRPFTPIDHHQFSDNMNVIATLHDGALQVDTAWVAAFIDGECRGVTKAINGIYYISVAGNPEESGRQVVFRTFYNGEVRDISETKDFASDHIEGDPTDPVSLTIAGGLGIDELLYTGISITPVRTQRMVDVKSKATLSKIEVFNTMGALVASSDPDGNKARIDLLTQPSGVYLVKAVDREGNTCVKRIIKTTKTE